MIALDIQPFFQAPESLIDAINHVADHIPTIATVFVHDESRIPYKNFTTTDAPKKDEKTLINAQDSFNKNGYQLPVEVINWVKQEKPDEVIISGGQSDFTILAAGISVFEAGFTPAIIPSLCYGNEWYQHTVTINIWEDSLGEVYESIVDIGL
jgi:nicotinamidase-related amidase